MQFALPACLEKLGTPWLKYELLSVRVDGRELIGPDASSPQRQAQAITYGRGGLEERFLPQEGGVEHTLLLAEKPGTGEITVQVRVTTPLHAVQRSDRILYQWNEEDILAISDAVAVDSAGRRLPLELSFAGDTLSYTVPAEWSDHARYPVLLDPFVGPAFTVDSGLNGIWLRDVDVAYNSIANEFLVVWNEIFGGSTFNSDVWGQRLNASGDPVGGVIPIGATTAAEKECAVSYAVNSDRYLVVWGHDPANDGLQTDWEIRGRIVQGDGTPLGTAVTISDNTVSDMDPDVASDGTGWYVVWAQGAPNYDIRGALLNSAGAITWLVDPDVQNDLAAGPAVAYANGRYMIVWEKGPGPGGPTSVTHTNHSGASNLSIVGQIRTVAGIDETGIFPINTTTPDNHGYPDVAGGGANFFVVWNRQWTNDDRDIHGRIVGSSGAFQTDPILIQNNWHDGLHPKVAWSSTNSEWLAVWEERINGTGDIYGKRIAASGAFVETIQVSTDTSNEGWPALAWSSSSNEMLIAWNWLGGPFEVRARRFHMGAASSPILSVSPTVLSFTAGVGGSNPASQTVTVSNSGSGTLNWSATTTSAWVSLTPPSGTLAAGQSGSFTVSADVTGLAAGTYSATVIVSDSAAGGSPQSIAVTLTLTATAPTVTGPTTLMNGTVGVPFGPTTFTASGTTPISWSVSAGSLPPGLTLSPAGLYDGTPSTAGSYAFTVTAVNSAGSDSKSYTHTIAAPIATIALSPTTLTYSAAVGGPNPATQAIVVSNAGTATLNWIASDTAAWLSTSPSGASTAPGGSSSVAVAVNTAGLATGAYLATISVTDPNASNSPQTISVSLTVNSPPQAPASLGQFKTDGTTAVLAGGSTNEGAVILKGGAADPDAGQSVHLEIELKPIGVAFDGTGTKTSVPQTSSAQVASVTIPGLFNGTAYHWRARAVDALGAVSSWVPFGENSDPLGVDFSVSLSPGNQAPDLPTDLQQYKASGSTTIPIGSATDETVILFRGVLHDADGYPVRLTIAVAPTSDLNFDSPWTGESGFVPSGSAASVSISGLSDGAYHWRARATDSQGATSGQAPFGANGESAGDFVVSTSGNVAPSAPTGPGQFRVNGTTPIAPGQATTEIGVMLKAVVGDPNPGQSVKLQVEVQPLGIEFTSAPTAESMYVAPGSTASIALLGLPDGGYRWRYRALDAAGATSAWSGFGPGGGDPDFVVATAGNTPPNVPSGLGQFKSDAATPIPVGGTTNETTVRLHAFLSDPDGEMVKLQLEVRPTGESFANTPNVESGFVASGTTATIAVAGGPAGTYRWQARSIDGNGAASSWTVFDSAPTHFGIDPSLNQTPALPETPAQTRTDGVPIAPGGSTNESTVQIRAGASDPDVGGTLRLQVELRLAGTPFVGAPTHTSAPSANGSTIAVSVGDLVTGSSYHWQVRTVDANDAASPWAAYGTSGLDFTKVANSAPSEPTGLAQLFADGSPIPTGGVTTESTLFFQSPTFDVDGDAVRLQIEIRPVGEDFTGAVTAESAAVPSGTQAQLAFGGVSVGGPYHWRARLVDSSGAPSSWIPYGENAEWETDFRIAALPPQGSVEQGEGGSSRGGGCGGSVSGSGFGGSAWWLLVLLAGVALRRRTVS